MSCFVGPEPVNTGLLLNLDAANQRSYNGSGTAWNDLSGNGNTATLTGSPTYSTANKGMFTFDGSTMYARISKSLTQLSIGNTYSFETFAKRSATCNGQIICGWQGFNGGVLIQSSNRIFASDWYSTGVNTWATAQVDSGITTLIDTWYHSVATFNALGFIRIYVNGVLRASTDVSGFTTSSGNLWYRTSAPVIAGDNFAGYRFPGSVSFGRFYNIELSAIQVQQNFEATRTRYNV
jgi:hypothetical protein